MNTQEIKDFALAEYRKNKDQEDHWASFSNDWDLNIYQPEDNEDIVRCIVYPVIDGMIETSVDVYVFEFAREPYTDSMEKWHELEIKTAQKMIDHLLSDRRGFSVDCVDYLLTTSLQWLRRLDQDELIKFIKQFDDSLLDIVREG